MRVNGRSTFPLLRSVTRSRTAWTLDRALAELAKDDSPPPVAAVAAPAAAAPPARATASPSRQRRKRKHYWSGSRPLLGRRPGQPAPHERRRRAPDPAALWQYLCGRKSAGEVAQTAEVEISTIHVWRCGQKLLRSLVQANLIPVEAWSYQGRAMSLRLEALSDEAAAAVSAHVAGL